MTPLELKNRRISQLERQLEDALAENRRLRVKMGLAEYDEKTALLRATLRLSETEARVLRTLYEKGGEVSRHRITGMIYGAEDDRPDDKIVDVWICRLRRKLAATNPGVGQTIHTSWGTGYYLSNEGRAIVEGVFAPKQETVP